MISHLIKLDFFNLFISPLFNQVGLLRTSSHLQLRPDKIKQRSATQTPQTTELLHME